MIGWFDHDPNPPTQTMAIDQPLPHLRRQSTSNARVREQKKTDGMRCMQPWCGCVP
jgi:hypothetical protein